MPNEHGNDEIKVGFSHDITGVSFWVVNIITGEQVKILTVEPEFARNIAREYTLESFKVDDLRAAARDH